MLFLTSIILLCMKIVKTCEKLRCIHINIMKPNVNLFLSMAFSAWDVTKQRL